MAGWRRRASAVLVFAALAGIPAACAPSPAASALPPDKIITFTPLTTARPRPTQAATFGQGDTPEPTADSDRTPTAEPEMVGEPSPTATAAELPVFLPGWVPEGAVARIGRGTVNQVAVSPDGEAFAAAGSAGLFLYRAEDFSMIWELATAKAVSEIVFSADGTTLAAAVHCIFNKHYAMQGGAGPMCSDQAEVLIVRAADGSLLNRVVPFPADETYGGSDLNGISLSADGATLYLAAPLEGVSAWDASTGLRLRDYPVPDPDWFYYTDIAFSADGTRLAIAAPDGSISITDLADGELIRTIDGGSQSPVQGLTFSPDGTRIAFGLQKKIAQWNISTGAAERTLAGSTSNVHQLAYSPDGRMLAEGDYAGRVILWNAGDGHCLRVIPGLGKSVRSVAFVSGGSAVLASVDRQVASWKVESGAPLRSITSPFSAWDAVRYSRDGSQLILRENDVLQYMRPEGSEITGRKNLPVGAVLSPYFDMYAMISKDLQISIKDLSSGNLLYRLKVPEEYRPVEGEPFISEYGFALSPSGAAAATDHGDLLFFPEGRLVHIDEVGFADNSTSMRTSFSRDGSIAAFALYDTYGEYSGGIRLVDAKTGDLLGGTDNYIESLYALAWDGDLLATDCGSNASAGVVCTYDSRSGDLVSGYSFELGGDRPAVLEFSPDGSYLAAGTLWGEVLIWNVATGEIAAVSKGHTLSVIGLDFSADGTFLASVSADGTVVVWNYEP
jgi:WD40 repeat protein